VENIQPADQDNARNVPDIVTAVIPGLVMSDRHAGDRIHEVARDMRLIAAPKHPGRDPVSVHVVDQLVSVLRGEGGLAPRLASITERLRRSAERLEATKLHVHATDQDSAEAFGRPPHEHRS
jgi:hypothetical protein